MFEKLGKRKAAVPLAFALAISCVFSLIFYPMANMEIKNLPFAILSQDEGVSTSEGDVNLGSLVAENIMSATAEEGEDPVIAWNKVETEEDLKAALEENAYYGAIVVPKDFSEQQYQTIVQTMQEQIAKMQSQASSGLSSGSSPLAGLASALSGSSATPQLSAETQKAIGAAETLAQGAQAQAGAAASAFAALQAKVDEINNAYAQAQEQEATLQAAALEAQTKYEEALAADPPVGEEELAQLKAAFDAANEQYASAQQTTQSLKSSAEQGAALLAQAKGNMASAQFNAKTAAVNAAGVKSTATAAATLKAKVTAMASAVSSLKSLAASAAITDEKIEQMSQEAAAKALVTAADEMKAQQGSTEEEAETSVGITVYLDMAKSPLIANNMKTSMAAMFAEKGIDANIEVIHAGTTEGEDEGAQNPTAGMMGMQIVLMPVILLLLVGGILITRIFKRQGATPKERAKPLVQQLVYSAVFSLIAAGIAYAMQIWVAGMQAPAAETVLFLWLASFCLMMAIEGLSNIALPLGALGAVTVIALGMSTGVLPFEVLPQFWQDWVFPWAPQRFLGEGLRSIMYMGAGAWNAVAPVFATIGAAGVVVSLLSLALPEEKKHA